MKKKPYNFEGEESVEHLVTVIDCLSHQGKDDNFTHETYKEAIQYVKDWVKHRMPKSLK